MTACVCSWFREDDGGWRMAEITGCPVHAREAALPEPGSLDVERLRHYLWSERHESGHRGDGYYETCMECMSAADSTISDLSEKGTGGAPE